MDGIASEDFEGHEFDIIPENSQLPQELVSKNDLGDNELGENGGNKWPGWPGENVFRMLIPSQKVGTIIGRKGEFIKKMTEETRARIKILDGPAGTSERAVMVSAKEEPDAPIPPAVDGLLTVHKRIVDLETDPSHATSGAEGTVITRLLLADTQAGSLIGKQGSTIKSIQDASNCIIRVLGAENLPRFALQDDSIVEIQGVPTGVHKALEMIANHLRKFLVDRSIVGVFEMKMQRPNAPTHQNMPSHQPWGPPPQGFPVNAGNGPGFGSNPQFMRPPRPFDNYYPPADMHPLDNQPYHGPPAYGRDGPMGVQSASGQPQQSIVKKVTNNMQIPLTYADALIGTSGSNISYIRRTSGAAIAVQETRGVPGEMTVEISGSASQIQTAQQLIQNCIAEASASAPQAPTGGTISHEYNSFPTHGPIYASTLSNATDHAGQLPAGDYGQVYGNNYGY